MTETVTVRACDMLPGDFLDHVHASSLRGPRGGRYRFDGVQVGSRIVQCGWVDPYRHARGFRVVPTTGPAFVLPGNSADLVDATVRRDVAASAVPHMDDDLLLAAAESPDRAVRVAALAELETRTGGPRRA